MGTVGKPKDPTEQAATCDTETLAQNSASFRFISRPNVHSGSPTGTLPLTGFERTAHWNIGRSRIGPETEPRGRFLRLC